MDSPGSNSLNKSMQGLWANHRRTRLNLNTPPASVATSSPTILSSEANVSTAGHASQNQVGTDEGYQTTLAAPQTVEAELNQPTLENLDPTSSALPSTKRKTRPTRPTGSDGPNKRQRSGAGSSLTNMGGNHAPPTTRLSDLGGVQPCVEKMLELVAMPLCHPEVYLHTGVQPPRGVLLHGPPGCGKTLLANAIAGEVGVPFISISAPSIVSGMSGESEKTLRDTFEEAKNLAPCLLFIDEIDAITPKRESAQREMERRIVAQFLTCMDELSWDKNNNKPVMVIGATNRPDSLDPALRRAGRFDHEITMGVPDEDGREQILRVQCSKLRLSGDFDLRNLAKATPGYVGADLAALTGAAGVVAVKRIFKALADGSIILPTGLGEGVDDPVSMILDEVTPSNGSEAKAQAADCDTVLPTPFSSLRPETLPSVSIAHFLRAHPTPLTPAQLSPLHITSEDFSLALQEVQPSSKREGFATIPDVTWADIGALSSVREELSMAVVQPLRRPELFKAIGVEAPCGVLLWGPPGCGKTLLAKAVANESRANFISVKGPELLNKYVGESERAVRQVFSRARASSPCVIFFDELDALVPRRDDSLSESSSRVVNTLLTELDGLDSRGKGVYIIAATNRPDIIDPAMCRPGRLDKLLYVDLPTSEERVEILRTLVGARRRGSSQKKPKKPIPVEGGFEGQVFLAIEDLVRQKAHGYSGADLASLLREAAIAALRTRLSGFSLDDNGPEPEETSLKENLTIGLVDFERALDKIAPSVSTAQRKKYESLRSKLAGMPIGHGVAGPIPDVNGASSG